MIIEGIVGINVIENYSESDHPKSSGATDN
jgi:hypothetical protein